MDKEQEEFNEKLRKEQEAGIAKRMEEPIGFLPDGKLNIVSKDSPRFEPKVEE